MLSNEEIEMLKRVDDAIIYEELSFVDKHDQFIFDELYVTDYIGLAVSKDSDDISYVWVTDKGREYLNELQS